MSHQDTLLDDVGRHYYKNCYIEGDTDFICGNAASLFEVIIEINSILDIYIKSIVCHMTETLFSCWG